MFKQEKESTVSLDSTHYQLSSRSVDIVRPIFYAVYDKDVWPPNLKGISKLRLFLGVVSKS